jgi:hypothetical protein
MAGSLHPYHEINGLLVPKFVLQEDVDKLKDFKLYPNDVWIVTYPKCGTTWTQQIVRLIRNNGEKDDVLISAAVPWLEAIARYPEVKVDDLPRPRAYKSHFPYSLMPCGPPHTTPCKYIFIARNPKDVAASLYFHTKNYYFPDIDRDSFWKKYIHGDLEFGNYLDHLLDWWPHREDRNVLFLKYEDMKRDLPGVVSQIASFIGVKLSDDTLAKIVHLTSFEVMKDDNTANYTWGRDENASKFMRKGIVGDWKNFLTAEQSAEMDAICADRLKDTGLEFEYE